MPLILVVMHHNQYHDEWRLFNLDLKFTTTSRCSSLMQRLSTKSDNSIKVQDSQGGHEDLITVCVAYQLFVQLIWGTETCS